MPAHKGVILRNSVESFLALGLLVVIKLVAQQDLLPEGGIFRVIIAGLLGFLLVESGARVLTLIRYYHRDEAAASAATQGLGSLSHRAAEGRLTVAPAFRTLLSNAFAFPGSRHDHRPRGRPPLRPSTARTRLMRDRAGSAKGQIGWPLWPRCRTCSTARSSGHHPDHVTF